MRFVSGQKLLGKISDCGVHTFFALLWVMQRTTGHFEVRNKNHPPNIISRTEEPPPIFCFYGEVLKMLPTALKGRNQSGWKENVTEPLDVLSSKLVGCFELKLLKNKNREITIWWDPTLWLWPRQCLCPLNGKTQLLYNSNSTQAPQLVDVINAKLRQI